MTKMDKILSGIDTAVLAITSTISSIEKNKEVLMHVDSMYRHYLKQAVIFQSEFNNTLDSKYESLALQNFEKAKERLAEKRKTIENTAKYGSIVYLSQSLLQIAQDALCLVHDKYPDDITNELISGGKHVKDINDVKIPKIIWEGRNQAIHYKDTIRQNVRDVFEPLIIAGHTDLLGYLINENMAYEIVRILGWNGDSGYSNFKEDMMSLVL